MQINNALILLQEAVSRLDKPSANEDTLKNFYAESDEILKTAPDLAEFISLCSIYIMERVTPVESARQCGFAHAGSVSEAASQAEKWKRNLQKYLSKIPEADRDYNLLRRVIIFNAAGLRQDANIERYASLALDIAFDKTSTLNADVSGILDQEYDPYGDKDQPSPTSNLMKPAPQTLGL